MLELDLLYRKQSAAFFQVERSVVGRLLHPRQLATGPKRSFVGGG